MSETQSPDLSEMIGQVLNDPDAMKSIAKLASDLSGNQEVKTATGGDAGKTGGSVPLPTPGERADGDRAALLKALRPFLNPDRQTKADAIIRMLGLLATAEKMGLTKNVGGLFGSGNR